MKFSTVILPFFVSSALALPAQQVSTDLVVREQAEQTCILDRLLGLSSPTNGKRDEEIFARGTPKGINLNVGGSVIEHLVGFLSTVLNGLLTNLTPKKAFTAPGSTGSFPTLGGATGSTGSGGSSSSFPSIPKIDSTDLLKQLSGFAGFTGGKRELAQGSVFSAMEKLVAQIAKDMPEAKAASVKITEAFNELNSIAKKQATAALKKPAAEKKPASEKQH